MSPGSQKQPDGALEKELDTASVSGAIAVIGTLVYFGSEPVGSISISAGVFLVIMISLGTFTFSVVDMVLDQPQEFSGWLSQTSWSMYSVQSALWVLLGLGIVGVMQAPSFSAVTNILAVSVVYGTMIGVVIWFAQETLIPLTGRKQTS